MLFLAICVCVFEGGVPCGGGFKQPVGEAPILLLLPSRQVVYRRLGLCGELEGMRVVVTVSLLLLGFFHVLSLYIVVVDVGLHTR